MSTCNALHCPAFSNHGWLCRTWSTTAYYTYYFDYLLYILFKGSCRTLGIYLDWNWIPISSSLYVSYKQLSHSRDWACFLLYTVPINWSRPQEWHDYLTTYKTNMHVTRTYYIYNYIYVHVVVNTRRNSATLHFVFALDCRTCCIALSLLSTLYCLSFISLMNNTEFKHEYSQQIVKSTIKMHIDMCNFIIWFIS